MIGQSKVLASPPGMATVAASIAAGKPVTPQLVPPGQDGAGATASPSAVAPEAPVTAAEAATLRELMRGVVEQGSGRFLADLPGEPVLAKSGTAEFGDAGALKEHAWMIAVRGDLAVAVFVEEGEGGAATAGPRGLRRRGWPVMSGLARATSRSWRPAVTSPPLARWATSPAPSACRCRS